MNKIIRKKVSVIPLIVEGLRVISKKKKKKIRKRLGELEIRGGIQIV